MMRGMLLAIIAMTISASAGAGGTGSPNSPLRLVADKVATGVRLRVVGLSPVACDAKYELEVSSGSGGNRSVQRGAAKVTPGPEIIFATTTLGGQGAGNWSATLRVDACDRHYEQTLDGDGSRPG